MLGPRAKQRRLGWFMNNLLKGMWKEAVIFGLRLLAQNSPAGSDEMHEASVRMVGLHVAI